MRGKVGLVIGLGIGYVLGTRAGRERYEQIKEQAIKLWELDPVQERVEQVKGFAKSTALAVPSALWNTATKAVKAATGDGTPGQKLDAAVDATKKSADDVKEAVKTTAKKATKSTGSKSTGSKSASTAKSKKPQSGASGKNG